MATPAALIWAASASQALPIAAGLSRWRRQTPARRWLMAWCAVLLASDAASLVVGHQASNNMWVSYITEPLQGVVMFWCLSHFQAEPLARTTVRLIIPLFVVAWIALVWLVEDTTRFSIAAEPMYDLLVLGIALFTLNRRAALATLPLPGLDWFWICTALAVIFGTSAMLAPLASSLVRTHADIVIAAYHVKAVLFLAAMTAMVRGMLCNPEP